MHIRTLASALAAAAMLSLAGCGAPHLKTVHAAERLLLGQDAAVLSRCIGEPMQVREIGFEPLRTSRRYSSAQARGVGGLLLASPKPDADADARACVFDVTVGDGRILAIESENRAVRGFGSLKNCSSLVERCVRD